MIPAGSFPTGGAQTPRRTIFEGDMEQTSHLSPCQAKRSPGLVKSRGAFRQGVRRGQYSTMRSFCRIQPDSPATSLYWI